MRFPGDLPTIPTIDNLAKLPHFKRLGSIVKRWDVHATTPEDFIQDAYAEMIDNPAWDQAIKLNVEKLKFKAIDQQRLFLPHATPDRVALYDILEAHFSPHHRVCREAHKGRRLPEGLPEECRKLKARGEGHSLPRGLDDAIYGAKHDPECDSFRHECHLPLVPKTSPSDLAVFRLLFPRRYNRDLDNFTSAERTALADAVTRLERQYGSPSYPDSYDAPPSAATKKSPKYTKARLPEADPEEDHDDAIDAAEGVATTSPRWEGGPFRRCNFRGCGRKGTWISGRCDEHPSNHCDEKGCRRRGPWLGSRCPEHRQGKDYPAGNNSEWIDHPLGARRKYSSPTPNDEGVTEGGQWVPTNDVKVKGPDGVEFSAPLVYRQPARTVTSYSASVLDSVESQKGRGRPPTAAEQEAAMQDVKRTGRKLWD